MADKILLIIGLLVAVAIVVTGGFGLLRGDQLGFNFNFLTSGPRASGPGWFGGSQEGVAPPAGVGQRETETPPPAPRPGYSPFEKRVRISNVSRPSDI
ncbi:MAG: hypothetical protein HYT40_00940, partial [Candidatus Sungbacteria bacterium]|nr:hypothetical protein [Candidatus Sungbacteria bacterium]